MRNATRAICVLGMAYLLLSGLECDWNPISSKVQKAGVIYEALSKPPPDYVYVARDKAIEQGLVPSGMFPIVDVNTASEQAEHTKEAVEAAKAAGLPALVVLGKDDAIIKAIPLPGSLDAILDELR